jgi:hypothetical protein
MLNPVRQIGPADDPVQSAFVAQATQVLFVLSQCGVDPLQSASTRHCTHCLFVESHMAAIVGHCVESTQPTQAPVLGSQ